MRDLELPALPLDASGWQRRLSAEQGGPPHVTGSPLMTEIDITSTKRTIWNWPHIIWTIAICYGRRDAALSRQLTGPQTPDPKWARSSSSSSSLCEHRLHSAIHTLSRCESEYRDANRCSPLVILVILPANFLLFHYFLDYIKNPAVTGTVPATAGFLM